MPMHPGGLNGGIKPLTLKLLSGLAERGWQLSCLCNALAIDELRAFLPDSISLYSPEAGLLIEQHYAQIVARTGQFDLHFFPMQHVSFVEPGCATVSSIMDVQYADRPENFTATQRAERARSFRTCVDYSDRIVAISGFTRSRIADLSDYPFEQIDVIPIAPPAMSRHSVEDINLELSRRGLEAGRYFIYPANFWSHKFHRQLLEGFRLYRERAGTGLKLVLTGDHESALGRQIAMLARDIGDVVLTGYVSPQHVEMLLGSARAMLFPSDYEGFGMPVIEAMMLETPVACAWTSSLPEVAGKAALLFDNADPGRIAGAIARISDDGVLRAALVARGLERVEQIGGHDAMVDRYADVFVTAMATHRKTSIRPNGVYADGWAGREATFTVPPDREPQAIDIGFSLPDQYPRPSLRITASVNGQFDKQVKIWRGGRYRLGHRFGPEGGTLSLAASGSIRPCEWFDSSDSREVSVRIHSATLQGGSVSRDLLRNGAWRSNVAQACDAVVAITDYATAPDAGNVAAIWAMAIPAGEARSVKLNAREEGAATVLDIVPISVVQGPVVADTELLRIDLTSSRTAARVLAPGSGLCLIDLQSTAISRPHHIPPKQSAPGFSVVIPSFNQGRFIERTLNSVLMQRHVHDVAVFDGGSSDDTVDILRSFGDALKFSSAPDNGQSEAVNKGIAASGGDIIAWINSDDTYEPAAFEHVANIFASHPDIDVVYGEGCHIDEFDAVIERYPTEDFDLERLFGKCFLCQPATFFRRRVVERLGALRESLRYAMDYELWLRLGVAGVRFHRCEEFLANSRYYAETKTLGSRPQVYFETVDMLHQCFDRADGLWQEHFANVVTKHLAQISGSQADLAFPRIRRLADGFWQRGTFATEGAAGAAHRPKATLD